MTTNKTTDKNLELVTERETNVNGSALLSIKAKGTFDYDVVVEGNLQGRDVLQRVRDLIADKIRGR